MPLMKNTKIKCHEVLIYVITLQDIQQRIRDCGRLEVQLCDSVVLHKIVSSRSQTNFESHLIVLLK